MTEGESLGEMWGIRISAIEHVPRRVGAKVEDLVLLAGSVVLRAERVPPDLGGGIHSGPLNLHAL